MNKFLTLIASVLLAFNVQAADKSHKVHDGNKIYYSVFNSSFVQPDIADTYRITRGKNRGLINIAVVPVGQTIGGKTALIKGTAVNILQQSKKLDFIEIREGDVVYYLASFKFDNEDFLTFNIDVKADPNKPAYRLSFKKTLYHD